MKYVVDSAQSGGKGRPGANTLSSIKIRLRRNGNNFTGGHWFRFCLMTGGFAG